MALPREFVVFDTETTGMPPGARLVEIGALKVRGGHIVDRYERLVYPETPIPQNVIRVHGIDDEAVAEAPTAAEVLPEFLAWAGKLPLVGHNVRFDASMLAAEAVRVGLSLPDNPTLCSLRASRRLLQRRSHSLENLVRELDLPPADHHRALADAQHTLHLLWKLDSLFGSEMRESHLGGGTPLSAFLPDPVRLPASRAVLGEALVQGEAIDLNYRLANGHVYRTRVSPRLIYRSGKHGWMEALCHDACFYKSYRLDRVVGARLAPDAAPVEARRIR